MSTKSLYVGNLSYATTEEQLGELFANYGGSNPRVIEGRGFGFVDVPEEHAEAAITAIHNSEYMGRTLNVSEARPRPEGGGGGGNRSGGGGGGGRGRRSYGGESRSNRW